MRRQVADALSNYNDFGEDFGGRVVEGEGHDRETASEVHDLVDHEGNVDATRTIRDWIDPKGAGWPEVSVG